MKLDRVVMGCFLAAAILPGVVLANGGPAEGVVTESDRVPLRPYKIRYLTRNWGMEIKLTRELVSVDENLWDLKESGSIALQKIRQRGRFRVEGDTIIPESFTYNLTGLIKRERRVQFPGDGSDVRSLHKGKWYEFPPEPGMLDRQSSHEQIRLHLLNGHPWKDKNLAVRIVDGRRVKTYELKFVGEETLETPLGPVETLHFSRVHRSKDRSTNVWLAPKWDYLMVKTLNIDGDTRVEAVATGGNIDGRPLREPR